MKLDPIPTKLYWDISKLKSWDKNPRTISEANFKKLKTQIQELGEYKPLLVTPDGEILGGNMRFRAYKELGYEAVWVSIVNPKTEQEKIKFAFSDNDQLGEYQKDELANLLGNIPELDLSNYTVNLGPSISIDKLLEEFRNVEEDEAPEISDEPAISKLGEVYQLGRHRLMLGDSTKIEDVEKLMNGQKVDLLLTDPPYGQLKIFTDKSTEQVGIDSWDGRNIKARKYSGDYRGEGIFKLEPVLKVIEEVGIDKRVIWGGNFFDCLPIVNSWLCWDKTGGNREINTPWSDFELAWTNLGISMRIFHFLYKGMMREGERIERVHPTEKPVQLSTWVLKEFAIDKKNILDLFGGSGSTLIACEQTNRICYMMEIDPKYCDVIRKRYAKFIGKETEWEKITPKIN